MATNYPAAADNNTNLPNPTTGAFQNNPDHASIHGNTNDAIKALEAKLGIGATTPSSTGLLLIPTGPGTTAWTQVTSSQLAASISDETGSGSAVFASTPTLITPKVDTINENTLNNGVTIDGVNLKDGLIAAAAIPTGSVTNARLAGAAGEAGGAWVDYAATSVIIGWSVFTNKVIRYGQIGKIVYVNFAIAGTSNSSNASFTLPLPAKGYSGGGGTFAVDTATGLTIDNGAIGTIPGRIYIDPAVNASIAHVSKNAGSLAWAASGTKDLRGAFFYETT